MLKKLFAMLAGYNQRPDPNTANQDLRDETTKNMNREHESEQRDHERMDHQEQEQQVPNPVGPSTSSGQVPSEAPPDRS